jgi:hypothetical protein
MSYKNKFKNTYIINNICENCIKLKSEIEILNTKIINLKCYNEILNLFIIFFRI